METILKGSGKAVCISPTHPVVIIGERINPTGKKKLAEVLRLAAAGQGDLEYVVSEAQAQVQAGADILDINVGVPGVDESKLAADVVSAVMEQLSVPLCLDSANPQVLRRGLEAFHKHAPDGKALINSVTGEEKRLQQVLPLVAEHHAAVIGLLMQDGAIPKTPASRLEVANRIVERATALGIPQEDILIDCLVMTIGAETGNNAQTAAQVTLETIRLIRYELGLNITIGASNVSHGLPERETLNQAFLAMAIQNGANAPIVDAAKARPLILAADLLLGRDAYAARFIKDYKRRNKEKEASQQTAGTPTLTPS